ncbi:MAG: polysulfide reductase [Deltaproteobacteria bacterium]|nr:polysulfide reductase [Deltaproteobacteria bacterium]
MLSLLQEFWQFIRGSTLVVVRGGRRYYVWIASLLAIIALGALAYVQQIDHGLIVSNMRDQLSWGLYIGNFAFLVGIAAAAVVLVIPAYIHGWKPIRDVVLLGEFMAVAAIVMSILFVAVDLGRPDRIWHMMPLLGTPNFPYSMLVWDVLVLTAYLAINVFIVTYLVYTSYRGRPYNPALILPIIFLSIPLAISIHTVTAFLFAGVEARPFWYTAILAPRFIASAFVSGPSLLVPVFMVVRRVRDFEITDAALTTIGQLLAYLMGINLFFLGCEVFQEFYSHDSHAIQTELRWLGVEERADIAWYTWLSLTGQVTALLVFVVPELRNRLPLLATGCVLAFAGVYIEKGLGLVLLGMTPDVLGEVYAYTPSLIEMLVGAGIWGVGALLFTLMVKVATAISAGDLGSRSA